MLHIIQRVEKDHVTLILSGRLDFEARHVFQTAMTQAQSGNSKNITLNLVDVNYIDSAGLGLLMCAQKELQDLPCQISLVVSPGHVKDVLYLVRMEEKFSISVQDSTDTRQPLSS